MVCYPIIGPVFPNKKITRIEKEVSGPNQVTDFTYDILDHVMTTTNPLDYVTYYGYTKSEEPNLVTDAESNDTVSVYNERSLLTQVIDANDDSTTYRYTANGDVNDVTDAKGNTTHYEYDAFGRLVYTIYPDDSYEEFTYDKNSNLTSRTNRVGDTIYYEYDAMNRLTVKDRPGDPNLVYTYDIAGRIYDVNDAGDISEYYYDRIGRMVDVNDPEDRLVSYEYDDRGLRTKLTYPDNSYTTYEYDALSRLTQIVNDSNSILAQYEYDELSRRTLVTLDNDANAVYEYDLGNRLTKLTNNIDDSNSITFEYSNYDNVGNRLSMKIDDANDHVYTYDNLYQLTFVDYNDSNTTSYSYDSLGNRTDVDDGSPTTYLRNNLNQYTSVGGTGYSYDNNGNLTDDGLFKFYYDCENRLTDVNDQNDTAVASYSYDYAGRRISKTVYGSPDVTTKYCYDGDQVIAEYDGSDNLLRKFIYGPGIDEPIYMVDVADSNAVYYYHFDGLGSVVALSDVNNVVVESYSYDVFGAPTIYDANYTEISPSAIGNPYMFTARRADDETALYYYRARYYAFDIGRFLQTDPIGYADGLNLYSYCGNNPIGLVDPSGLSKESDSVFSQYERYQAYIRNAEQAMIDNIARLEEIHGRIEWTHRHYRRVLYANTALSAYSWTKSAVGIAKGVGKIGSATQSLGTNPLQEIYYGPGKDLVRAMAGEKQIIGGGLGLLKEAAVNIGIIIPMTKIGSVWGVELSIAGARRKLISNHEQLAEQIMNNITSLSNGISEARRAMNELGLD